MAASEETLLLFSDSLFLLLLVKFLMNIFFMKLFLKILLRLQLELKKNYLIKPCQHLAKFEFLNLVSSFSNFLTQTLTSPRIARKGQK